MRKHRQASSITECTYSHWVSGISIQKSQAKAMAVPRFLSHCWGCYTSWNYRLDKTLLKLRQATANARASLAGPHSTHCNSQSTVPPQVKTFDKIGLGVIFVLTFDRILLISHHTFFRSFIRCFMKIGGESVKCTSCFLQLGQCCSSPSIRLKVAHPLNSPTQQMPLKYL